MRIHIDSRRRFVADLFPTPGDVNIVTLQPGVTVAWHRHQHQDDYLYCARGTVEVHVVTGNDAVEAYTLTEWDSNVLCIPRNHWHGYRNLGPERAVLVGYNTQKYDPNDEERRALSEWPWN